MYSAAPATGKGSKAIEFRRKAFPSEAAISSSLKFVLGATSARTLPPTK
jgi:hypothetical protein